MKEEDFKNLKYDKRELLMADHMPLNELIANINELIIKGRVVR